MSDANLRTAATALQAIAALPFWLDEAAEVPDQTWRRLLSVTSEYEHRQRLAALRKRRRAEESPRRQKLFRKAQATIAVMVALRGVYGSPVTITAWYGRHGRRLGLFAYYDDDHEIQWTPQRGFRVIEIQDLPF